MNSKICTIGIFLLLSVEAFTQARIHAHNDYAGSRPLFAALEARADCIEADVYPLGGELLVAHAISGTVQGHGLWEMYIQPIIARFKQFGNRVSADTAYRFYLMVDIKRDAPAVIKYLTNVLGRYPAVFDRSINSMAVQVVLSGERGNPEGWTKLPSYIMMDGRPSEHYTGAQLNKVAFVSESVARYSQPHDSLEIKLRQLSRQVHAQQKLLRLWGIPDNQSSWQQFAEWGVDIINTDHPDACRQYFNGKAANNNRDPAP